MDTQGNRFLRIGPGAFFRQDSSGQLTAVTEPETLKGLKSGNLPFSAVESTRGLKFGDQQTTPQNNQTLDSRSFTPSTEIKVRQSIPPQTNIPAGNSSKTAPVQGVSQESNTDINSLIKQKLASVLKEFAGTKDIADLEARKQALLRKSLTAPIFPNDQQAEAELTPEARIRAIRQRGSEFEPEIQALDRKITEAKQENDPIKQLQALSLALDLQERLSPTTVIGGESNKEAFNQAKSLRQEFIKASGDFTSQRDAYNRILASAKDPSPAGDLALIFNYMKLLDPRSVVREGEFATAENSAGVPTRIRNWYNKILSGRRLGPDDGFQRDDFVDRSNKIYAAAKKQQDQRISEYQRLANAFGLDPNNVIVDLKLANTINPSTSNLSTSTGNQQTNKPSLLEVDGVQYQLNPDDGLYYEVQ